MASTDQTPRGEAFLQAVWSKQHANEEQFSLLLPTLGEKAGQLLEPLGDALSLIYEIATCARQCDQGDHAFERLAAKCFNDALASLCLIRGAHYDQSFAATRNVWELGNLLQLFFGQPEAIAKWKTADAKTLWKEFKPAKVRERIKAMSAPLAIEHARYGQLSVVGSHVGPHVAPQTYTRGVNAIAGIATQPLGMLAALNELSEAVSYAATFFAYIRKEDAQPSRQEVSVATDRLIKSCGRISVQNYELLLKKEPSGAE